MAVISNRYCNIQQVQHTTGGSGIKTKENGFNYSDGIYDKQPIVVVHKSIVQIGILGNSTSVILSPLNECTSLCEKCSNANTTQKKCLSNM